MHSSPMMLSHWGVLNRTGFKEFQLYDIKTDLRSNDFLLMERDHLYYNHKSPDSLQLAVQFGKIIQYMRIGKNFLQSFSESRRTVENFPFL